jgi:hypothetical protein
MTSPATILTALLLLCSVVACNGPRDATAGQTGTDSAHSASSTGAQQGDGSTGGDGSGETSVGGVESSSGDAKAGSSTGPQHACSEDEFVADHVCVPCPADSTNAAGDDPSGPSTLCDDACTEAFAVTCDAFEEAYVKPSSILDGQSFGWSTAVHGNTVVVGSTLGGPLNGDGHRTGAVHVFEHDGSRWFEQATLDPSPRWGPSFSHLQAFGWSVSLDGDTLAVGSFDGVAVLHREGTDWVLQSFLTGDAPGFFAAAVHVRGDVLAVGAPRARIGPSAEEFDTGAVWIYTRSGSTWTEQAMLTSSSPGPGARFGASVALSGDRLAVGAPEEGEGQTLRSGGAYIFERTGDTWSSPIRIQSDAPRYEGAFGTALDLDGETLIVSELEAVHVFEHEAAWVQAARLHASTPVEATFFGISLARDGDRLVVGAVRDPSAATGVNGAQETDPLRERSGAAYVFEREDGEWTERAYVKAPNTDHGDWFGFSVALHGELWVIGAPYEDSAAVGINGDPFDDSAFNVGAAYIRQFGDEPTPRG